MRECCRRRDEYLEASIGSEDDGRGSVVTTLMPNSMAIPVRASDLRPPSISEDDDALPLHSHQRTPMARANDLCLFTKA
jgi:hypothetical protein